MNRVRSLASLPRMTMKGSCASAGRTYIAISTSPRRPGDELIVLGAPPGKTITSPALASTGGASRSESAAQADPDNTT
jgi:hypothetical protein